MSLTTYNIERYWLKKDGMQVRIFWHLLFMGVQRGCKETFVPL